MLGDGTVWAVVALFSIVQSLFGLGLLVFGTPSLLLLGYEFLDALAILVPASLAISLLQIVTAKETRPSIAGVLYWLCLPGIGLGLVLVRLGPPGPWVDYFVGFALLASAALRLAVKNIQPLAAQQLAAWSPAYHLVMGLVHGLTNLGGALLAILAASTHCDKRALRYMVAYYYVFFGLIQLAVLVVLFERGPAVVSSWPGVVIAAAVYALLGNRLFERASASVFQSLFTVFTAAYGVAVLVRA
ncbi:MAG: TSUP family transporter [Gammaproteobacteria bacterium]|nr:TSUP family transporter [Gammaproteobacteria bacterium]